MNGVGKMDILTRVEGHCSVELIRDGVRVVGARLNLHESPRLFEALLVGRRFDEVADIACRICSICSTVHKVTALQAVEQALGVVVSRQTRLLRELAVQGGQIESHALHIFCLALPDYLEVGGIHGLAARVPEKLRVGLGAKKLGNLIQEVVGGRAIHPFNLLVGGVGRVPGEDRLHNLKEQLAATSADIAAIIDYLFSLDDVLPALALTPGCVVRGGAPLFGDRLVTSTGITIPATLAAAWLNEQIELHTHAKVSRFGESTTYMVGPLARLMSSMPLAYAPHFAGASIRSSQKARIVELQMALERAQIVIGKLLEVGLGSESSAAVIPVAGEGTALVEAPRGVLLHSYSFDRQGTCKEANIITPTAINQMAMAASLKELVVAMDGAEYDQVRSSAELLMRCYDPCISCAVH